jgi:hypothetical protein
VARVTAPRPRQVIVIEDSDEDVNEVIFEEDGGDDDLMFNETVIVEDD